VHPSLNAIVGIVKKNKAATKKAIVKIIAPIKNVHNGWFLFFLDPKINISLPYIPETPIKNNTTVRMYRSSSIV
jgi:hypothetical protein